MQTFLLGARTWLSELHSEFSCSSLLQPASFWCQVRHRGTKRFGSREVAHHLPLACKLGEGRLQFDGQELDTLSSPSR